MFVHYAPNYILVSTKCKVKKGHNSHKADLIIFYVNQLSYSSALVSSPSFKALAQIVIKISCNLHKMPSLNFV